MYFAIYDIHLCQIENNDTEILYLLGQSNIIFETFCVDIALV